MRQIKASESINEALSILLKSKECFLIGEGVPDPKAMFGTTKGLKDDYPDQVFDMPVSENAGTGICIGAAVHGLRPIISHMRIDFTLYAADQLINNAAKWWPLFGFKQSVPMVVRAIVGRGFGNGPQHTQQLDSFYAEIPGLKVVYPSNAYNAKGLLMAAAEDPNPVLFIEHRWVHLMESDVPKGGYTVNLGEARIAREGKDLTIVTWGYMTAETLKACEFLSREGLECEVVDLQTVRPIDYPCILSSLAKTKRLLVVNDGWPDNGISSKIISTVCMNRGIELKETPVSLTTAPGYCPATPFLSKGFYPTTADIVEAASEAAGYDISTAEVLAYENGRVHDVANEDFRGPF